MSYSCTTTSRVNVHQTQCLNVASEFEIALLLGLLYATSQVEDNLNAQLLFTQF